MTGDYEKPMTMDIVEGWQRHREFRLEKWEREAMFAMDRAFRRSVGEVLQYHARRPVIKALMENKDKDWSKAQHGGLRNSSL